MTLTNTRLTPLLLLLLLLLAACGAQKDTSDVPPSAPPPAPAAESAQPAEPSGPTPTPYPPEIEVLVDARESALADIQNVLNLYNREDYSKESLDAGLRSLVPTAEALTADLIARGVEIQPVPLPPTPELAPEMIVFDTGMVSDDGVKLAGTYYGPANADAPGIVLLHMLGGERGDWDVFARQLQAAGYGVLAIDLRGHGDSAGERDYANMTLDAAVAVKLLRAREELDGGRIALIGASIGANIALNYAAEDADVRGTALLSPGEDYRSVTTLDALERYGERPLFIAASSEDRYAADSARALDAAASGPHELFMLEDQGHGTAILGRENGLEERLIEWLGEIVAGE